MEFRQKSQKYYENYNEDEENYEEESYEDRSVKRTPDFATVGNKNY